MPNDGPVLGRKAVKEAKVIFMVVAGVVALLGLVLICGGLYLALSNRGAQILASLFGSGVSTTSVGFGVAFLGAVLPIAVLPALLRSLARIAEAKD